MRQGHNLDLNGGGRQKSWNVAGRKRHQNEAGKDTKMVQRMKQSNGMGGGGDQDRAGREIGRDIDQDEAGRDID